MNIEDIPDEVWRELGVFGPNHIKSIIATSGRTTKLVKKLLVAEGFHFLEDLSVGDIIMEAGIKLILKEKHGIVV